MDTGIFCGRITKDQLVEQNKQLSQQIKENQHNIQLYERWETVQRELGTDALETLLRRCDSLASALAKPKFPEFPNEVRELNLEGLMFLCLSFSKGNDSSYWESFTASKLHNYMHWKKITLAEKDKEKILNRMRTKSMAFKVFKSILDHVQREGTNQMEVAAQPTTTQPTIETSQAAVQNKRTWSPTSPKQMNMSKRHCGMEQAHDAFEYSLNVAVKSRLHVFWANELVQTLEQHETWGQLQVTDHVRARYYRKKAVFVIDWPEDLPEPNLEKVKVFPEHRWGDVEIRRPYQLRIRTSLSQGKLISDHVFNLTRLLV